MTQNINLDKEELRLRLSEEQFKVTQQGGTETPFSGKYYKTKDMGMYHCVVCGAQLFSSDTKIDPARYERTGLVGWPSFDQALPGAVEFVADNSHDMQRTEVVCSTCGAHLGHVFDDAHEATGQHFCINSCALELGKE